MRVTTTTRQASMDVMAPRRNSQAPAAVRRRSRSTTP
jgi:hypothetical protein